MNVLIIIKNLLNIQNNTIEIQLLDLPYWEPINFKNKEEPIFKTIKIYLQIYNEKYTIHIYKKFEVQRGIYWAAKREPTLARLAAENGERNFRGQTKGGHGSAPCVMQTKKESEPTPIYFSIIIVVAIVRVTVLAKELTDRIVRGLCNWSCWFWLFGDSVYDDFVITQWLGISKKIKGR